MKCAVNTVKTIFVKIYAVRTGMAENAVKNYFYIELFRLFAKMNKILLRSEHRVNPLIIRGIVFVI